MRTTGEVIYFITCWKWPNKNATENCFPVADLGRLAQSLSQAKLIIGRSWAKVECKRNIFKENIF